MCASTMFSIKLTPSCLISLIHSFELVVFQDHNNDFIVKLPDWDPSSSFDQKMPHLWYSTQEVINALQLLLKAGDNLRNSATYR